MTVQELQTSASDVESREGEEEPPQKQVTDEEGSDQDSEYGTLGLGFLGCFGTKRVYTAVCHNTSREKVVFMVSPAKMKALELLEVSAEVQGPTVGVTGGFKMLFNNKPAEPSVRVVNPGNTVPVDFSWAGSVHWHAVGADGKKHVYALNQSFIQSEESDTYITLGEDPAFTCSCDNPCCLDDSENNSA